MATQKKPVDKKVQRAKKRRRLQIIRRVKVGAVLCMALAVVLYLLSAFVFFRISAVEVVGITDENGNTLPGSAYYTEEEIVAASGVQLGDSLVNISKTDIARAVEKMLPYVGKVTVKRAYPSTLRLTVEDTNAYFAVESGTFILLDKNFKVLTVTPDLPENCAKLVGLSVSKALAGDEISFTDNTFKDRINTLVSACEQAGLDHITKINLSNIANVQMVFNNRITVTVGTVTKLDDKLATAKKTIEAELANDPLARILVDVTDASRAYVRDDNSPFEEETDTDNFADLTGNDGVDEPDGFDLPAVG